MNGELGKEWVVMAVAVVVLKQEMEREVMVRDEE